MEYYQLINELKKVVGALSYDGDASVQVLLPTKDGKYLRVGVSDDNDVENGVPINNPPPDGIWFDYYEGLNNEIKNNLPKRLYTEEGVENLAYRAFDLAEHNHGDDGRTSHYADTFNSWWKQNKKK